MAVRREAGEKRVHLSICVFCKFFIFGSRKISLLFIYSATVKRHNSIALLVLTCLQPQGAACEKEDKYQVKIIHGGDLVAILSMGFIKHLLIAYDVPGAVPRTGNTMRNKNLYLHGADVSVQKWVRQTINT